MKLSTAIIIFFSVLFADPCSAPWLGAAHSGAPGEVNCTGCHSGSINMGPGNLDYTIGSNSGFYLPNTIYTMMISLSEDDVNQFGFQTVALRENNNANVGNFTLTDEENTRIIEDDHNGSDRIYVGHTVCGADTDTNGSIQWEFAWQAPDGDVGDINFYVSSLATNHNHSTVGDNTYFQIITISPQTFELGDLNQDGEINILDVVTEVNIILEIILPTESQLLAGDINSDGILNVLDIVMIVNLILGE